jgi:leucyl aminopeptidase
MTDHRNWLPETGLHMGVGGTPQQAARAIRPIQQSEWEEISCSLSAPERDWLGIQNFDASPGSSAYAPNEQGLPGDIWLGVSEAGIASDFASLAAKAQEGRYRLNDTATVDTAGAALGWALGTYRFNPAGDNRAAQAILHLQPTPAVDSAIHRAASIRLSRDLVNLPAQDLSPAAFGEAAKGIAAHFGANATAIVGEDLLSKGFPAIHAVGRAAAEAPRLIDIRWGDPSHPPVTLVGKGVCFDTGGLNVKSMAGMRHMKRDMGGAAVMLGLGALIMSERLPIRLRILLPIVENAIAGNAMRPGDLIPTRDGATIEVENTDCEGRIILADALTYAIEEDPELVIDCATLTGSARTAFGGEIQALFASNDALGQALQEAGAKTDDALWQMPIWAGYRSRVSAPTGDLLNMAPGGYAGAITAALFLQHFARDAQNWAHLDISAWNDSARPGRPVGGEATGLSAIYDYLKGRFGQ